MGDSEEAIGDYTTRIDLDWLASSLPAGVRKATLVSADADLNPADIPRLRRKYGAVAADWESGAIARVAARNGKRTVILRGVTDLVGRETGEAYGNLALFQRRSEEVMASLLKSLPWWLERSLR
jgi:adenosylhomocysteine nucleosidase